MNERIKELMPKPWTFPYPDREMYSKEQMEHLIVIVVRECADKFEGVYTDQQYPQPIDKTLKQMFGIK